jgi:hypothetical protein
MYEIAVRGFALYIRVGSNRSKYSDIDEGSVAELGRASSCSLCYLPSEALSLGNLPRCMTCLISIGAQLGAADRQ